MNAAGFPFFYGNSTAVLAHAVRRGAAQLVTATDGGPFVGPPAEPAR